MRARFLGLALAGALLALAAWLAMREVERSVPIARMPAAGAPREGTVDAAPPDPALSERQGTASPGSTAPGSGPCSLCAELELAIADLERKLAALEAQRVELGQQRDNRPNGVLASLSDVRRLTERERSFLDYLVRDVPVVLVEGEAEWIARHVLDESGDYDGLALVSFLGRERVLEALDPLRLELFREYHFTPASWSAAFPDIPYEP